MANWCDNYIIIDKGLTKKQFDGVKNIVKNREENHKSGDTIFMINDMEFNDGIGTVSVDSRWVAPAELLESLHSYLDPLGVDITCLSYEQGCQIFSKYVNGDFTHYEYTDVPYWFLRLFGDDLIEEFTARRVSNVVAGVGLQILSELEHIKGIDWEHLKFCASDYNNWGDLAPCVQNKINSKLA